MTPHAISLSGWFGRGLFVACLCAGSLLPVVPLQAQEGTLLTLTSEGKEAISLDLAALDQLPQNSFSTTTQWTEGEIAFSGPALRDVLQLAGATPQADGAINLIAANHYEVELDRRLLEDDAPIVATRLNGKTFGTREKGPLWVVFPYDLDTAYQTEGIYAASIWQLIEIRIED